MMRTPLRFAVASVAAATLVGAAAEATAEPIAPAPAAAPATAVAAGTGSSAVDAGTAALQTFGMYLQQGDVIGLLGVLAVTPFQMLTGTVCDMASISALPNPCHPLPRG